MAGFIAVNAQSVSSSPIPTVRYCDLVRKADDYNGKQIRIRAEYNSGFEHSVFADSTCVKTFEAKQLIWVEFDEIAYANTKPDILARFKRALYRPEVNEEGATTEIWKNWYVELTVVGIFQKSKDPGFGFGHTNAYPFMIAVSKIDRVGKLKKL